MQKIISAIMAFFALIASFFGFGKTDAQIKINADKNILAHYEDYMSPSEILDEVSNVSFKHEMNTKGLTEKSIACSSGTIREYYDKNGKIVYKSYLDACENYFIHYTKSKSGKPIEVGYVWNYLDEVDITINSEKFDAYFFHADEKAEFRAQSTYLSALGKKVGLLQESITYIHEGKNWTASAEYVKEDGCHSYESYYQDGKLKERDDIIFENKTDFEVTDMASLIGFYDDVYINPQLEIYAAPFYSTKSGKTVWYYQGVVYFYFDSIEQKQAFADKFEIEIPDYEADGNVLTIRAIIPIAEEMTDFSPYDLYDVNDPYTVSPEYNANYEIIKMKLS